MSDQQHERPSQANAVQDVCNDKNILGGYVIFAAAIEIKSSETAANDIANYLEKFFVPWYSRLSEDKSKFLFDFLFDQYYYQSFADVSFPERYFYKTARSSKDLYKKDCFVKHFSCNHKLGSIIFENTACDIEYADIYLFYDDIGIVTFKVSLNNFRSAALVSTFLQSIRNINSLFSHDGTVMTMADFLNNVVLHVPSFDILKTSPYVYNNKFKSFVFLNTDEAFLLECKRTPEILYRLASAMPLRDTAGGRNDGYSESFMENQCADSVLTIYNNWTSLFLHDTYFTINTQDDPKMEESYFSVYIHVLFLKFYLYKYNKDLSNINWSYARHYEKLRRRYMSIYYRTNLTHISYNYLPNIVYNKIRAALDIEKEILFLKDKIKSINVEIESDQKSVTNMLLFLISVLSIFSVIKNSSEWVFQMTRGILPNVSYTDISEIIVLFIIILISFFLRYKHNKTRDR